jgi:outer membrane protein
MLRLTSLAVLAALIAGPAAADTLPEAMTTALDGNPTLAAARARLAATKEAVPQAWAEALPQISLSAGASVANSYPTPNVDAQSKDWSGTASVSQLLFGSGRVLFSTRAARAQVRGAVADFDGAQQQLLLDVAAAYADMREAQAVVDARQTTVSNLTTLQDYAQAQFDAGVVTRTDVAQAQARLAQARTLLVQAQGQLAAAFEAYQRLVGKPPENLEAPQSPSDLPADLDSALNEAGHASPFLRSAQAATEQADANVQAVAAQGRFNVTLEAGSSVFGDLYRNSDIRHEGESSQDSVGVRFSLPLFSGGAERSRTRAQKALRSAANLDLAAAQRSVQEQVTNAWTGMQSARAAVTSTHDQVTAAELAYQGIRLEQETGLRSTIDVLNQEQDLLDARLALAAAERDLVVAERGMLAALGALKPE